MRRRAGAVRRAHASHADAEGPGSDAHTLPHDWQALGAHTMYGAPLDPAEWAAVTVPVLVVYGAKSPEPLRAGSKALAAVLPARSCASSRARHNVKPGAVVPLIAEFCAGSAATAAAAG